MYNLKHCVSSRPCLFVNPLSPPSSLPVRRQCSVCDSQSNSKPAQTTGDAVQQARAALRQFRECLANGDIQRSETTPVCCRVQLPLPVDGDDAVKALDESDWPGGIQQKYRTLKPLVEDFLFGYNAEFAGMLESQADGIGVWHCEDMTVVCNVTDVTFEPFVDLLNGEYGAKPTQPGHTVIAVNCSWSQGHQIGQFWQKKLKQQATEIIEGRQWHDMYHLWVLRSSRGATAWLYHSWGDAWRLYHSPDEEDGRVIGKCIKIFNPPLGSMLKNLQPDSSEVLELMIAARDEYQAEHPPDPWKLW